MDRRRRVRLACLVAAVAGPADAYCWPNGACCDYKHFCGWSGEAGAGQKFDLTACTNREVPDSFSGYGSWIDNQTPGTRAIFQDRLKPIYFTPGAYSYSSSYDWHPVWYIEPCGPSGPQQAGSWSTASATKAPYRLVGSVKVR